MEQETSAMEGQTPKASYLLVKYFGFRTYYVRKKFAILKKFLYNFIRKYERRENLMVIISYFIIMMVLAVLMIRIDKNEDIIVNWAGVLFLCWLVFCPWYAHFCGLY